MALQTVSLRSLMNRSVRVIVLAVLACGILGFTPARLKFDVQVDVSGDREKAMLALERVVVASGGIPDASPDGSRSWYVIPGRLWGAAGEAFLRFEPQSVDVVMVKVDLGPFRTGCSRPDVKTPAMAFLKSIVHRAAQESGISMSLKPEQDGNPPVR